MALLYSIPAIDCDARPASPVDLGTEYEDIIVEEISNLGFSHPVSEPAAKMLFEEIGLDSMDMINLVVALEDRLGIEISTIARIDCGSIKDLVTAIVRQHT